MLGDEGVDGTPRVTPKEIRKTPHSCTVAPVRRHPYGMPKWDCP